MNELPKSAWPPGDVRFVYLHWTAGDHATLFPSYHACIGLDADGVPTAYATFDPRANMRDVRHPGPPYAAHTAGRNSYALGIAICGMANATPRDFGPYALRDDLVALACVTTKIACGVYGIPIDAAHVRTHAEAAVEDGYFGDADDRRWDIARLVPSDRTLEAAEATAVGDSLRARIVAAV